MIMNRVAALTLVISSVFQCMALKYDPSKTYSYSYETDVFMNDASSKRSTRPQQNVGVKLAMNFQLSTVYQDAEVQFFKLTIGQATVSSAVRPNVTRELQGTLGLPVLFLLSGDTVDRLYFITSDSTFSRNVKKGIIALFQVQENEGQRTEVDVSGECQVTYKIPQPDTIYRIKKDCQNLEIAGLFTTTNKALGVTDWQRSNHHYQLKDSVIDSVTGTQNIITYLNIRSALNGGLTSSQKLQLESSSTGLSQAATVDDAIEASEKDLGAKLEMSLVPSDEEFQQCTEGCESPKSLVAKFADDLHPDNLATLKSAKAFTELLKSFRASGKSTLSETFITKESYLIVSQLIDVVTAAQTDASQQAILELLNFEDTDAIEYPQRFLFAAAYSSHPSPELISQLLSILNKSIPNESLRESLLLSLGAIVNTYCKIEDQCGHKAVEEFQKLVLGRLSGCTEVPCKLMYLRALGNAGLPDTVTTLLKFAETPSDPMIASTAISSFRRIRKKYMTEEVKSTFQRIFHQIRSQYDSSVRVMALEGLLGQSLTVLDVRQVLLVCLDQSNGEFSTYVVRLLLDAAMANTNIREALRTLLANPFIHNYNIWSQGGKSSVITSYLAKMKEVNATYNLFFENSPSGVMKRSGMTISLLGAMLNQQLMKFSIYADGLESLVGEDSGEEEADEMSVEATAGMGFYFMDVLLTQVEFFRGTSGLMSAVWNAPSELTSALQGNILLQDHSQRVHLSNGLIVNTQVLGALSMDLSGLISISLWNRNCEALIRNSGALYLEGSIKLVTEEFDVGLTFSGEGQNNIDFTSNADFYEMPLKLCMEMKRPEFEFIHKIHKHERIKKFQQYKSHLSVKSYMSGESYFLNKANSEECRVMLKDEDE